jgi:hypothetical protein
MPNEEVKLYIPEKIVRDLEAAAKKVDGYTRNEIAVDVIRQCLPIWLAARDAFDGVLEEFLRIATESARERRHQKR